MERGSPLSEAEQRRLRAIEDDLARDPELSAAFDDGLSEPWSQVIDVDRALGAGAALGVVTIVLSLVWELPALGLLGFGLVVAVTDRLVVRRDVITRTVARWRRIRESVGPSPEETH